MLNLCIESEEISNWSLTQQGYLLFESVFGALGYDYRLDFGLKEWCDGRGLIVWRGGNSNFENFAVVGYICLLDSPVSWIFTPRTASASQSAPWS